MNDECLHRLLMDRACDELSDDAAELLAAYTRLRPETAGIAAELESTMRLARQAMISSLPMHHELPPLSPAALEAAGRRQPLRTAWTGPLAMAACLILGLWLGGRTGDSPSSLLQPIQQIASTIPGTDHDDGFWSVRRLATKSAQPSPPRNETLHWSSPLAWPRIGDRS